jgi:hypothetical protein
MNLTKFILNILLAIVFLLLMDPRSFFGLPFHEWAGLLIVLFFLLHKILNWSWIKKVTTSFFKRAPGRARINYILDILLLTGLTLIVLSGIAIARTIDFSWLNLGGSRFFWRAMHVSSSMLVLALFGIHLGIHWRWVLQRFNFKKARNGKEN